MIPRFRADEQGGMGGAEGRLRVGLLILESCLGSPIIMNSVLDGLRDKKFAVIQDDMILIVDSRLDIAAWKSLV